MGKSRCVSPDSTRPGPALFIPSVVSRLGQEATAKKQRPRSNGQEATAKKQRPRSNNDRRSTSMALAVAMRAVATLALLLAVVLPAAGEPLRPALKQAQCPVGSMQSGGYCTPLFRNAPPSAEKRGLVPEPARSEKSRPAISIRAILVLRR